MVIPLIGWLCLICGLTETMLFSFGFSALWWPGARAYSFILAQFLEPASLVSTVISASLLTYARWPAIVQTFPSMSIGPPREIDTGLCLVLLLALALNIVAVAGMTGFVAISMMDAQK